jgi:hypothetical protein
MYNGKFEYTDEEKVLEYCKDIIEAVKKTRYVVTISEQKSKKVKDAISSGDKRIMWEVLQEYLRQFSTEFIAVYGIYICQVDADFYNRITEKDIKKQLQIVRGLIYTKEAVDCAAKETIKKCLKKLLKKSGIFTDREIEALTL